MSFLGRGRRRRKAAVFVAAGSLMAFQALAIIGAQVASAVTTCSFNLATGAITVGMDGTDTFVAISVVDAAGNIETDVTDCASATTANTTSVGVSSTAGATDETFEIDNTNTGGNFPSTISWAVDLAGGTGDYLGFIFGASVDTLTVGNTTFTMNGAAGVTAGLEFLYADGGAGNDVIDGSSVTSTLAWDFMSGGPDNDTLKGGAGDDGIEGEPACTAPDDDIISGGAGDDDLFGDCGDDTLSGDAGVDDIEGEQGSDTIIEGTAANGADILDGDSPELAGDIDTIDYSGRTTATVIFDGGGAVSGADANGDGDAADVGDEMDDVFNFETLVTGSGNDTITGDAGDDTLIGGAGNDALNGGANGAGGDTADYSTAPAAVTVSLAVTTAQPTGGGGTDTLTALENLTGSAFNDTLTGDGGANTVTGGDGNDAIAGGLGADTELGGGGNDTFDQGAATNGGDTINGESGLDWVDYDARTSGVTVDLPDATSGATAGACNDPATEFASGASGEGDCIVIENAALGVGDDTFVGDGFNNLVQPGGGSNILDGGAGGDTLDYSVGYTAGVIIDLGGGAASTDAISNFENVTGTGFADAITGSATNNLIKSGGGADRVRAGSGDDTVRAGAGNDNVRGGSGDDDLFGGAGNDSLSGGAGDDFCLGGKGKKDTISGCESGHA